MAVAIPHPLMDVVPWLAVSFPRRVKLYMVNDPLLDVLLCRIFAAQLLGYFRSDEELTRSLHVVISVTCVRGTCCVSSRIKW